MLRKHVLITNKKRIGVCIKANPELCFLILATIRATHRDQRCILGYLRPSLYCDIVYRTISPMRYRIPYRIAKFNAIKYRIPYRIAKFNAVNIVYRIA